MKSSLWKYKGHEQFRTMGEMQGFTFNQLWYKNCFGKINIKFIGPPSSAKVVSRSVAEWTQIDKIKWDKFFKS